MTGGDLVAFAAFGLLSQCVLVLFFAARRWAPRHASRYGWVAYAFGIVGAAEGIWWISTGASWRLFTGPLLFATWAAFGAWVDLVRPREWRQPVRWSVLAPYLVLYLAAQMFLWWPLWNDWRPGWAAYLLLFVANTALNLVGHPRPWRTAT